MSEAYPLDPGRRTRWIIERRGPRHQLDPLRPYAFLSEQEPDELGNIQRVSTLFLTNSECPWKCVMCDLWRNTLSGQTPLGAIPKQIDYALAKLVPAQVVKLYNAGSFFDRRAVPEADHAAIIGRLRGFSRVVVECHPRLLDDRAVAFRDRLNAELEVAIGLETADANALAQLNKQMSFEHFAEAVGFARRNGLWVRVFLLVHPPFVRPEEASRALRRSIDLAFDAGAQAISLIPARGGNGAMEALAASGQFHPPTLDDLESAFAYGLEQRRGRVFADLWDIERLGRCPACAATRIDRLAKANLNQLVPPALVCHACGGGA